ncbi:radical SAM protein [Evtepia sp.]|uniref:radical SAM protein n=1 Tax=Evtepia sp. TaxID=2773933 RepID=UPI003F135124
MKKTIPYAGFELGPIRPPSEAYSLLLRINRGCGWNKCRFCGFYRDIPFSIRSAEDIKKDIDRIKYWVDVFQGRVAQAGNPQTEGEQEACYMAYNWIQSGMKSVFFQDGNSILMNPDGMIEVLEYLKATFPQIQRITSYARSDTINRLSLERLTRYRELGLNRFHIGLETGNDYILKLMNKGVDKATQIQAGIKAKAAGIEINEFYMPNMGGREYARESALDTADVMNQVNPDFIRIRSMALAENLEMYEDYRSGMLTRPNDIETIQEIRLFIENLHGITSVVDSDHILNILLELRGKLPEGKDRMLATIDRFLEMPEDTQNIFRLGRRIGVMSNLRDLNNHILVDKVKQTMDRSGIDKTNIDAVCDQLMIRCIPI